VVTGEGSLDQQTLNGKAPARCRLSCPQCRHPSRRRGRACRALRRAARRRRDRRSARAHRHRA
jgi:hypothetical protein